MPLLRRGSRLLSGHGLAGAVQSHLGIHTQASLRVFAESLFFQVISFPTGFTVQLPRAFELRQFKWGRFQRSVSEVGLKPTAKSSHQKSQQLLNTPSKLLVRTWSAVGPFSCPQAFGCPSAQWICTSWSPCCSRHAAPRTQPVCLNIGLGMAHFGFDSEAIPHAMGDTPPYRGQISENSHFHPSDRERQKNGLAEMEEV